MPITLTATRPSGWSQTFVAESRTKADGAHSVENASSPAGLKHLAELAEREGVEQIVVGLPVTLRGERGAQAEETEAFVTALKAVTEVPIESFDERFTTKLAESQPSEAPSDAVAAAHLLSTYLEWKSALPR